MGIAWGVPKSLNRLVSLVVSLSLASPAMAAQFQLKAEYKIRAPIMNNQEMVRVGSLAAGSVVEIPDEFIVKRDGEPDLELSINKWLSDAGRLVGTSSTPLEADYDGNKRDFFFPVKIVNPAPGSTIIPAFEQNPVYLALRHIQRGGSGFFLRENLRLVNVLPEDAEKAEAGIDCDRDCDRTRALAVLDFELQDAFASIQRATSTKTEQFVGNAETIAREFPKSCGMELSDFTQRVHELAGDRVLAEMLTSILINESAGGGLCDAVNSDDRSGGSWGLFQINAGYAGNPSCRAIGNIEKESFANLHAKIENGDQLSHQQRQYESDYRACRDYLRNPVNNAKEAISNLKKKEAALFDIANAPFDRTKMSAADQKRLILSAYNGGERWVIKAKEDLLAFNERHHTRLNPDSWDDLRVFFLRSSLSDGTRRSLLGDGQSGRAWRFARTNIAYTETLIPLGHDHLRTISGFVALGRGESLIASR